MPTGWQLAQFKGPVLPAMTPQRSHSLKLLLISVLWLDNPAEAGTLMCQPLLLRPEGKTAEAEVMSRYTVTSQCFFSAVFTHFFFLPAPTPSPQPSGSHIAAHTCIQKITDTTWAPRYAKAGGRQGGRIADARELKLAGRLRSGGWGGKAPAWSCISAMES